MKTSLDPVYARIARERNHLEMFKHPEFWPCWPVLPLKRPRNRDAHGFPEVGILTDSDFKFRVYLTNIFGKPLADAEFVDYESFDAITADGWEVD